MLWMVLVVLWIEFAVTFCAGLVSARRGARVLGVAFPANQAHSPEVNRVVRTYQIRLAAVFVLLTASSSLLLLPAAVSWRCARKRGGPRPCAKPCRRICRRAVTR